MPTITAVLVKRGDPVPPAEYEALPDGTAPSQILVPSRWQTTVRRGPGRAFRVVTPTGVYDLARPVPQGPPGRVVYRYLYRGEIPA